MINHPVHIIKKDYDTSPSAFIPFCEFGGNMSAMGVKIDQFDVPVPVCNSFQAKIFNDQLCYEVDLNVIENVNTKKQLKSGFAFIMDYNEDRQIIFVDSLKVNKSFGFGLVNSIVESDYNQQAIGVDWRRAI